MKKYQELEFSVLNYADENDLLKPSHLLQQSNKLRRDIEDLHEAVIAKSKGMKEYFKHGIQINSVEDSIGNSLGKILFDLILMAEINNVSLENKLEEYFKSKK